MEPPFRDPAPFEDGLLAAPASVFRCGAGVDETYLRTADRTTIVVVVDVVVMAMRGCMVRVDLIWGADVKRLGR